MGQVPSQSAARRTLIEMARRRQQPGAGSGEAFLRERTAQKQWPDLDPVLAPIAWAIVGAVATRHYMPERATRDLDKKCVSYWSRTSAYFVGLFDSSYVSACGLCCIIFFFLVLNHPKQPFFFFFLKNPF